MNRNHLVNVANHIVKQTGGSTSAKRLFDQLMKLHNYSMTGMGTTQFEKIINSIIANKDKNSAIVFNKLIKTIYGMLIQGGIQHDIALANAVMLASQVNIDINKKISDAMKGQMMSVSQATGIIGNSAYMKYIDTTLAGLSNEFQYMLKYSPRSPRSPRSPKGKSPKRLSAKQKRNKIIKELKGDNTLVNDPARLQFLIHEVKKGRGDIYKKLKMEWEQKHPEFMPSPRQSVGLNLNVMNSPMQMFEKDKNVKVLYFNPESVEFKQQL